MTSRSTAPAHTASPPDTGAAWSAAAAGTAVPGRQDQEVTPMQLSALIDQHSASATDAGIPCQKNDAELWFAESPADVELAKSLCGPCPARAACLAAALARAEPWGVWGGQLVIQGAIVSRKRPRGRPRKNDVVAA